MLVINNHSINGMVLLFKFPAFKLSALGEHYFTCSVELWAPDFKILHGDFTSLLSSRSVLGVGFTSRFPALPLVE